LQALLDKKDTQSQQILGKQLGVNRADISLCLRAIGKIQMKIDRWNGARPLA